MHSPVDDHFRLAYAEMLTDEKGATAAAFLLRGAGYFAANGSPGLSGDHRQRLGLRHRARSTSRRPLGAKQRFIKPHCPWQNGKVERFNRTIQIEWAYRQAIPNNPDRAAALDPWLELYNTRRRHTALGGLPPTSQLSPTL